MRLINLWQHRLALRLSRNREHRQRQIRRTQNSLQVVLRAPKIYKFSVVSFKYRKSFGYEVRWPYASPAFVKGISRMRLPVAAKIALYRAGANGGNPGSPIPAGGASLSTMWILVTRGDSFIRATWKLSKLV